MNNVTIMGEALVDVVGTVAHPGGSPLNVAVGLSRLGHMVTFSTELGGDDYGQLIGRYLEESGVQLAAGSITGRPTSTAVVTFDEEANAEYCFDIHQDLPAVDADGSVALLHSGSIASWISPSQHRILEAFRAADATTLRSYDPNLRPALVEDRDAAVAQIEALCAQSHIVKLSDVDAQWIYPELSFEEVLADLASLGPALVVITKGSEGCLARYGQQIVAVKALPTTVHDTIGAGDAFMSGLLHGVLLSAELSSALLAREELEQKSVSNALHYALASAAHTVAQAGANPPWSLSLDTNSSTTSL
ncbi:ribokinase [Glutamicibacter uratoxydans]|uniref:Ribokinase n=1 Tax=Glutamicibacter uratoxydans TaxID=43667 RepID=A0A4Y4DWX9_GLUUR|nr:carbohydrate kinase [Glutamicibacter uratoxydans]GED07920.1 ribokinase [Glutamicibacter uratoxydans]